METIRLLTLAIAPGLAIMLYVYNRDKYEKEPFGLMLISFLLGALSIFPAIGLEMLFMRDSGAYLELNAYNAFFAVGFSEELVKFLALMLFAYPKKAFNEPYDGIVYAVMVSMGFATFENILYVMEGGRSVGLMRMFTAVPAHAAFGVMMGYFVGMAKFGNNKFILILTGLLLATLFHGAYDFFLFVSQYGALFLLAFVVLIVGVWLSFKAFRAHQNRSPFKKEL
jgi:protease PrsW